MTTSSSNFYNEWGSRNLLGEAKKYINIGYWVNQPTSLDAACDDLIYLAASELGLDSARDLLDVGCGYGEQDFLLAKRYPHIQIHALNHSEVQLNAARTLRIAVQSPSSVSFQFGRAESLPYGEAHFDRVLSVEAPFHFRTRRQFVQEVYRVLRPEGKLVFIDFCLADKKLTFAQKCQLTIGRTVWRIPKENLETTTTYGATLLRAGFTNVKVQSIWADSYPPFVRYARKRLKEPTLRRRMRTYWWMFLTLSFWLRDERKQQWMDYVLVTAEKSNVESTCG